MPKITTASDAVAALGTIATTISDGQITIEEAQGLADVVERTRRAIELVQIEQRIAALEARHA